jgi:pilus assembly protein CpaF
MATIPSSGHIIAVIGGKGGVGKSVFTANFAMALCLDRKIPVAAIDADMQGTGDLNLIFGIKQPKFYGNELIESKIRGGDALKKIMTQVNIGNSPSQTYALQLMQNPERLIEVTDEKMDIAMRTLKSSFSVSVIDCGSRIEGGVLKILEHATIALVVTNPEILVLNQTKKILEKFQTLLFPLEFTKMVLNKLTPGNPYNAQFLEQTLKRQVLASIPEENDLARAALGRGQPMITLSPNAPSTKAYIQLGRNLFEGKILEKLELSKKQRAPITAAAKSAAGVGGQVVSMQDKKPVPKSAAGKDPVDPRSRFKLLIHEQLVEKMDLKKEQLNRQLDEAKKLELREKAMKIVTEIVGREDHPWKNREESSKLVKEVLDEALGLGPLEDLLADRTVTEIMVNRADLIFIEKGGRNCKSPVVFSSNVQVMAAIERIVNPLGRRIDEKTPYVDARLPDGSRVHAIIPPLAIDGPMITIRKFPEKRFGPEDLVKFGSMSREIADFLRTCIEARLNVLISGGTGSGKTTLLNVLSSFIPATERILTVEDAAELSLIQEHVGRLETRPPNIEGAGAVTIRDLVKQTLRMKPDRIIVGEVRGGEALDMLQAMNTGHDGSMATVHANNPRDALARLETLVLMAGMELPAKAIREQISSAVHLIVQQSRLSDGSRRVTHITEVAGMQGEVVTTQDIFVYKQTGMDKDRKIIGKHVATGFIPKFVETIEAHGVKVPRGLFKSV